MCNISEGAHLQRGRRGAELRLLRLLRGGGRLQLGLHRRHLSPPRMHAGVSTPAGREFAAEVIAEAVAD